MAQNKKLVLVPKVGKEQQWESTVKQISKIIYTDEGWWKEARTLEELVGNAPESKRRTNELEELLRNIYEEKLLSLSEIVTVEEAKKRKITTEVLFGRR